MGLKRAWKRISNKGLIWWLENVSFFHILVAWAVLNVMFGFVYFGLSSQDAYLRHTVDDSPVVDIWDAIYFSFVSATTTGFGDEVPVGLFKLISVFQVILGMLLLAVVTSKLVSIRQNAILSELYEISFNERMNRLRSSLLLFRQHVNGIIGRIERKEIRPREVKEIYTYLSSLEDTLKEMSVLVKRGDRNQFVKDLDSVNTELVTNSIIGCFKRLIELLKVMDANKLKWHRTITIDLIERDLELMSELFTKICNSDKLDASAVKSIKERAQKINTNLKRRVKNARKVLKGKKSGT